MGAVRREIRKIVKIVKTIFSFVLFNSFINNIVYQYLNIY